MFNREELRKMIIRLNKIKAPYVVVDAINATFAEELKGTIIEVCNQVGLMVAIEQDDNMLQVRNLFFSSN